MNLLDYKHLKTPGIYKDRDFTESPGMSEIAAVDTWCAVGVADTGVINEPVLIHSFQEYIDEFARGTKSPFKDDSDLAYAVYGFFQNGGARAYIVRVAGEGAKESEKTIGGVSFQAKNVGAFGNSISVEIVQSEQPEVADEEEINKDLFDVIVYVRDKVAEEFIRVNAKMDEERYIRDVINAQSKFVEIISIEDLAVAEKTALADGEDGEEPNDLDYMKGVKSTGIIKDIAMISIPGQTSALLVQDLLDFCEETTNRFAIVDPEIGLDYKKAIEEKYKLNGYYGITYFDWGHTRDMLRPEMLKLVPLCGHIAGANARTERTRGVHKAAAGETDGRLVGIVKTNTILEDGHIGELNEAGIISVVPRANGGVMLWGARLMTPQGDRKYITDLKTDIFIEESIIRSTKWAMFEPNGPNLWSDLDRDISMFMRNVWRTGAIVGDTSSDAFFVKIDEELNTQEVQDNGFVFGEVGYRKTKVSEFIVFKFKIKQKLQG